MSEIWQQGREVTTKLIQAEPHLAEYDPVDLGQLVSIILDCQWEFDFDKHCIRSPGYALCYPFSALRRFNAESFRRQHEQMIETASRDPVAYVNYVRGVRRMQILLPTLILLLVADLAVGWLLPFKMVWLVSAALLLAVVLAVYRSSRKLIEPYQQRELEQFISRHQPGD